jgi:anti-sigma-K factor RskA
MTNEHPFIDDIPAYAIGALDPVDAAALQTHLKTCQICLAELAAYGAVSEALLMASPPQPPPAALRQRLQARLPGAQKVVARPKLAWSFNQFAFGFAILLLLALNAFFLFQMLSLQRQQALLTRQVQTSQTALAALAYPETRSLPISGENITGTLLLDQERNVAVVIAWNLPALQASQTYQIWLIDPQGKRTSAGIFAPQPDLSFTSVSVLSPGSLSNFTGIGVTVEPAGGSSQPTGKRIFKVDF